MVNLFAVYCYILQLTKNGVKMKFKKSQIKTGNYVLLHSMEKKRIETIEYNEDLLTKKHYKLRNKNKWGLNSQPITKQNFKKIFVRYDYWASRPTGRRDARRLIRKCQTPVWVKVVGTRDCMTYLVKCDWSPKTVFYVKDVKDVAENYKEVMSKGGCR